MSPSILLAWFTTVSMCFSKVNSVSTYMPRSFSLVVVASVDAEGRAGVWEGRRSMKCFLAMLNYIVLHSVAVWPTCRAYVDGRKSENILFSGWHPHAIWLLRALSFDGKLCLRDGRNAAFLG